MIECYDFIRTHTDRWKLLLLPFFSFTNYLITFSFEAFCKLLKVVFKKIILVPKTLLLKAFLVILTAVSNVLIKVC